MSNMTIHDVPEELRSWIREKARTHHQSISQEILGLLATMQPGLESSDSFVVKLARIEELCRHCADASFLDAVTSEELAAEHRE
jgi:plasmid stability protein